MIAAVAADKAAVVCMLENIHRRWDVSTVDVEVMLLDGKASVVAGADIPNKTIMLPRASPDNVRYTIATTSILWLCQLQSHWRRPQAMLQKTSRSAAWTFS
jgi:hypothetical protein